MIDEVTTHIQELIASGVCRVPHPPFSSNKVLFRKQDESLRLCIDYRQLNSRTIRDNYALISIEILDSLSLATDFFLCLKSGYFQIEIKESHKDRTAFTVGTLEFYEFNTCKMGFGIANAPAIYQRLQEKCLGDLHLKICYIYLDNLFIFSRTIRTI